MTPELITTPDRLGALVERLRRETLLAFDTEAASFHRYADRVYLIQVSSVGEAAIIDPLALPDLSPVGDLLASPQIEIVFHDADYDLRSLHRDYGFEAHRVFDTRIAAQLLGEPEIGLGALLHKYFRVVLDKKLQRADWSQRPLTREMIDYAAADTAHLPALREVLYRRLVELGRLEWAREEFQRLEGIRWSGAGDHPDAYLRIKGAKALAPREQAVLRALFAWRERRAQAADRAPFRVLSNEALLAIARAAPTETSSLKATTGVPASVAQREGTGLVEVVRRALSTPARDWPPRERGERTKRDPEADARFERLKSVRNERAKELGLEPGVLCSNAVLQGLAREGAGALRVRALVPEFRAWQKEALGETRIFSVLNEPSGSNAHTHRPR
ncbi:MAG: ribonuclease D [Gemmatimonadetes bacterium]|nr:ribonuclease D [Gemmatimonadota bacterium]